MTKRLSLKVVGLGHYLPDQVIPSADVEKRCGIKPGWIARKTGVLERRWVNGETCLYMGAQASREAIADAGVELKDIDLIINASGTQPQAIPDGAHLLQRELGLEGSGIACMTVHTTCLSFLTAMHVAGSFLENELYKNILIVSADIASCGIDFSQPESAALFGDAAAAAVVTRPAEGEASCVVTSRLEGYSEGADFTKIAGGGTLKPPSHPESNPSDNVFYMEGPNVYRLARKHISSFLEEVRPGLSKGLGTIKHVIPHQASIFAVRALRKYGVPDEQVSVNLDKYGNCIAASLPLTLYEAAKQGRFQRGDEILLVGTGAGLCLGAMILVY
jgi:3-oxoacyl-[acyl-carrier-protein] synthase III